MRVKTNRSTTRRVRAALSAAVVVCAVTTVLPAAAWAEPTAVAGLAGIRSAGVERVSVAADGTQADDNSGDASITPDGRHIVFSSSAKNLTPDQTTGGNKVFVRDQQTRAIKRIGDLTALQPPVISGDGEYVVYPVRWMKNVRLHQYQVGTGREASPDCSAYSCNESSLNADGLHIALTIFYQRPSPGQRIEVQDWNHGGTRATVATLDHTEPSRPSISGDGRYVAYQDSQAGDVFVWDRTDGTTSGPIEDSSNGATLVQLSSDGTKVVYLSDSDTYVYDVPSGTTQLVPNARGVAIDPTGRYLLYAPNDTTRPSLTLRDLQTDTDQVVSDQPASAGTNAVSAGGRDVIFQSTADDIVPGDTNGKSDVFVRHFDRSLRHP